MRLHILLKFSFFQSINDQDQRKLVLPFKFCAIKQQATRVPYSPASCVLLVIEGFYSQCTLCTAQTVKNLLGTWMLRRSCSAKSTTCSVDKNSHKPSVAASKKASGLPSQAGASDPSSTPAKHLTFNIFAPIYGRWPAAPWLLH
eukprot:6470143-Amphidinium_carterae.1